MKNKRMALAMALALVLGLTLAATAQQGSTPAGDPQAAAESLRFGQESFQRGLYGQAKAYFKQALQADPSSETAWSFYDLCVIYDVAEQVKKAGRVVSTDAASPAPAAAAAAPPAPAPAPAMPAPPKAGGGMVIGHDEGC
ncbi:hypothetical protein Deba_0513 [Desulfarculus baarsii DSM 2075]|uniref:Uncharacterized protein n=1 Tax=Desulfarculus baarsii (strain ATCC 33931 / DSM 2075 / LMG 7858 / VKM B-1802 / 2st14) TaxID=644282 RepID=E1QE99_DESB2|nr:hypothetical protein [Desulfarculus baarsii]ADK83885.1 hypothetical protein Deba_0513 [Desulfarculus baarsii DSM 2075]